jgi:hypothetical protein
LTIASYERLEHPECVVEIRKLRDVTRRLSIQVGQVLSGVAFQPVRGIGKGRHVRLNTSALKMRGSGASKSIKIFLSYVGRHSDFGVEVHMALPREHFGVATNVKEETNERALTLGIVRARMPPHPDGGRVRVCFLEIVEQIARSMKLGVRLDDRLETVEYLVAEQEHLDIVLEAFEATEPARDQRVRVNRAHLPSL